MLRRHRIVCSLVLFFAMMFTQLAVAAYACPDHAPAAVQLELDRTAAHCYGALDPDAPQLCWQHYQSDKQSAHQADGPSVSPVYLILYLLPVLAPPIAGDSTLAVPSTPSLARSVEPPIFIRNCCFRT